MNETNKISKAAYLMSGISAILSGLILLAMLVLTIYVFVEAPKDPNGGGWAIFIVVLLGVALIPYIIFLIGHCITILLSFLKRNKRGNTSKGLGIAGTILGLLTNGTIFVWVFFSAFVDPATWEIWVVVFGALLFAAYQLVNLILFIKMKNQN